MLLAAASSAARFTTLDQGWVLDHRTVEDGLPINHLNALARGPDRALWAATFDGVVVVRGLDVEVIRARDVPGLHSSRAVSVAAHPGDGAIWVIYEDASVARFAGDGVRTFPPLGDELPFMSAGAETLWAAAGGPLYRLDRQPSPVPGSPAGVVQAMEDLDGTVWLRDEDQRLSRLGSPEDGWESGLPPMAASPRRLPDGSVGLGNGRELWALGADGLVLLPAGSPTASLLAPPQPSTWSTAGQALYRDGRLVHRFSVPILELEPSEDGVWLATQGEGLVKVREALVTVHRPQASTPANVTRLWWDPGQGSLWAMQYDGHWWSVLEPERRLTPAPDIGKHQVPGGGMPLWREDEALVWSRAHTLVRDPGNGQALEPLPGAPPIPELWSTWRDPDGGRWLGVRGDVYRPVPGGWEPVRLAGGRSVDQVRSITGLPDGSVLLGAGDGAYLAPAEPGPLQGPLPGLDAPIREVAVHGDYVWWSTEERGLCATPVAELLEAGIEQASVRCPRGSRPEHSTIHALLADDQDRFWMSSNAGIGVIQGEQLRAFARGDSGELPALWLDESDGMRSREANGQAGGGALKTPDGQLWFATQDGVVQVDPRRISLGEPPTVRIVPLGFEGREGPIELEPSHPPLRLHWSASVPDWDDQVEYRHRIGSQRAWSAPSREFSTTLSSLPPGRSSVDVQARLGGAWGPVARLVIERRPSLSEHPLILPGVLLVASLLAALVARWRSRALEARARALEQAVDQRTAELTQANAALAERAEALAQALDRLGQAHARADAQAEQLARQAELRRALLADLSHELRNPLALLMGPLELLEGKLKDQPDALRFLDMAARNASRLEVLVTQLFELAKLEAGAVEVKAEPVEIRSVLQGLLQRLEPGAEARSVRLDLTCADCLQPLWMDPELLDRLLSNLLVNALRHSPEGGRIELEVDVPDDPDLPLRVSVQDQGPGVPPELAPRVFERFAQGRSSRQAGGGAGLGLAMVQQIAALHGGRVGLAPPEPGRGARFWVELPRGHAHLADHELVDPPLVPTSDPAAASAHGATLEAALVAAAQPHLAELDFTPTALAAVLGSSHAALGARMREAGLPEPAAWLLALRLDRAEALLRRGAHTSQAVAEAVGLHHPYFLKAFSASRGQAPQAFVGRE
jgi:signal transduction histidine kinase/AraC-like DNA-binding protein